MLKAGALYYAIFVLFVVSVFSSFFILLTYHDNLNADRQIIHYNLRENIESVINTVLTRHNAIPFNQVTSPDLFGENDTLTTIEKKRWGAYLLVHARSKKNKQLISKNVFCGEDVFYKDSIALYLTDLEKHLSIAGKSELKGNCYLPRMGIRSAYIEGVGYSKEKLVDGKTLFSDTKLPDIDTGIVNKALFYLNSYAFPSDSMVRYDNLDLSDSIVNSFDNKTLVVYSPNALYLDNVRFRGNIIIISKRSIDVGSYARLDNVILYSPFILFRENAGVRLQAFASDSIVVKKNCRLNYPGFLGLITTGSLSILNPQHITISSGATVAGGILTWYQNGKTKDKPALIMEKESKVYGQVYCNDAVEMKGHIIGSLFCNRFILRTYAALYENHLYDGVIDFKALSKYYAGTNMLMNDNNRKVIGWVE